MTDREGYERRKEEAIAECMEVYRNPAVIAALREGSLHPDVTAALRRIPLPPEVDSTTASLLEDIDAWHIEDSDDAASLARLRARQAFISLNWAKEMKTIDKVEPIVEKLDDIISDIYDCRWKERDNENSEVTAFIENTALINRLEDIGYMLKEMIPEEEYNNLVTMDYTRAKHLRTRAMDEAPTLEELERMDAEMRAENCCKEQPATGAI